MRNFLRAAHVAYRPLARFSIVFARALRFARLSRGSPAASSLGLWNEPVIEPTRRRMSRRGGLAFGDCASGGAGAFVSANF